MYENIRWMVRRVAAECGGRKAIECGEAALTYRELEAQAGALTDHLLRHGLARGSVAGLLTAGSSRLVTAILGVLDAGGIFLPLDPRIPAKRLAAMVEEASPQWFLVDRELAPLVAEIAPGTAAHIVVLDEAAEEAEEAEAEEANGLPCPERPEPGGDDPCYIYFTSGSTGRPKGVTGRLKAIDHFIRWEIETFDLAHGPRVSQLTAPSFDAFLRDAFVPLCSGGTLCVPPESDILGDAGKLVDWIDGQSIELVHCVPSLLRTILSEDLTPERFSSLRRVLLAGEPLLPLDVERWTAVFGGRIELVNLYGPSETTMVKFFHRVQPEDAQRRTIPIGQPMRGARGLILDARSKPRPTGAIGEIYIRTPYRSLGYYNRPEETSQVFLRNPLSDDPNDLLYRTGDLGRVLDDGSFELLGRKDQQVKVRGVRVELEEIESVLLQQEPVREAAVVDQRDAQGNLFLAGFVVLRPGGEAEPLRDVLAALLPEAMVPSRLLAIEELPRSANGKIDRRALRELAETRNGTGGEHVAHRNELEALLAGLFSRLLGIERVGIHDNFFQLGGHSLLAMQLVARVRHALALEVPLRSLLQHPTVAGLAQEIETLRRTASSPAEVPPLVPAGRGADLPLSYSQQQFWFLQRMEPESNAYTIFLPFHLAGRLDAAVLAWTLDEIVRRHEVLRTTFVDVDGVPELRIAAQVATALPQVDLGGLEKERRKVELWRLAREERRHRFDLAAGPLLRVLLVRLGETEHAVLAALHHIAGDGWSLGVLIREIGALYTARCAGRTASLPDLPIQYADFAHWQRRWLAGEVLEEQLAYWRERLGGVRDALRLPTERPRHGVVDARSAYSTVALSPGVSAELAGLSRNADATLFMTLLAGYMALLHGYAQQEDIVVGTPIANRRRIETEGLIGLFANTLVLRVDLSGNPTFRELIARVREAALGAYAHQDLPFVTLVESLRLERDPSRSPLFQVWFVLQNTPQAALDLPGLALRPLELGEGEARHDLKLDLTETPDGLRGSFEYRTALFRPAVVEQMARDLEALLELVTRDPEVRLDQLRSALSERARRLRAQREDDLQRSISRDLHGLKGRTGRRAPTVVPRGPVDASGSRDEERR